MKGTFTFLSDCFDCVHMVQVYCTRVLHGNALTIPSRSRVFFPVPTSVVSVPASTTPDSVPFPASYLYIFASHKIDSCNFSNS